MKIEYSIGNAYPAQIIRQYNTGDVFYRFFNSTQNSWTSWMKYITDNDLGGAVFQPASGNIKYGMNGIYVGKFNNGPLQSNAEIFDTCIYLIGTGTNQTAVYAFVVSQYSGGHIFFNRMSSSNSWQLSEWKKLIA